MTIIAAAACREAPGGRNISVCPSRASSSGVRNRSSCGSTNGGAGIRLAYRLAEQAFIPDGINRVLLATDGDFNVGTVSFEALIDLIAEKRKSGIALTTLGVGTDNYDDQLLEQLADTGNGNYAYLDSLTEAQRVLITERSSTLQTCQGCQDSAGIQPGGGGRVPADRL